MADIFLSAKELALRWKMSVHTLTNWRVQNVGPAFVKMGSGSRGRVLYRLADVEAYEAQRGDK